MATAKTLGALALSSLILVSCASESNPEVRGAAGGKADGPTELYDHAIRVESVWTQTGDATAGKQTIAILRGDAYSHSEHFVLFGEKNGSLRVRDFQGQYLIFDREGHTETSSDNFYTFTAVFVTDDQMDVTLVGLNGSTFELSYERQTLDDELEAGAEEAIAKYYAKYDELRESEVETVSDLKKHVRLHLRTHDYGPNDYGWDAPEWQFETQWLQIEGSVALGKANSELADVEVSDDGTDAVSQHYLEARDAEALTNWNDVPDPEDILDNHDWNEDVPVFHVVEAGIEGVEPGPIRDGLELFATHTFKTLTAFECEGGYDFTTDFHWYLSDGTTLSYYVHPECD